MPHERGSGANWNNVRKGGLQSMPIGLGQNAPGVRLYEEPGCAERGGRGRKSSQGVCDLGFVAL